MGQNNPDDLLCRIWATEISPDGHSHRCHAEQRGLRGNVYVRGQIEEVLEGTLTLGGFGEDGNWRKGTWQLIACQPNHDGSACSDCQYSDYSGKAHLYGEF